MQFKDIVGQTDVANRLTEIIDSGRVSHAQLVLGPTTGGSLQVALAYLQYLCCEDRRHPGDGGLRADSCGECPSCKKMASLMHPDLHLFFPNATTSRVKSNPSSGDFQEEFRQFIAGRKALGTADEWFASLDIENKQGQINVRDAADIIQSLSLKSYEGGWKMVVVWMAEKMNESAANELLKTLEEPTPGTIIILVAESDERLLQTIKSRVQVIRLKAENGRWKDNDGLQLAEETRQQYAEMLVAWLRLLFKLKMKQLAEVVDKMAAMGREQQKTFLQFSLGVMRGCFLASAAGVPYSIGSGDEKFDAMFPKMVTANNIEAISNAFSEAIYAIERNAYSKIALMELSFRLSKALKKR